MQNLLTCKYNYFKLHIEEFNWPTSYKLVSKWFFISLVNFVLIWLISPSKPCISNSSFKIVTSVIIIDFLTISMPTFSNFWLAWIISDSFPINEANFRFSWVCDIQLLKMLQVFKGYGILFKIPFWEQKSSKFHIVVTKRVKMENVENCLVEALKQFNRMRKIKFRQSKMLKPLSKLFYCDLIIRYLIHCW